MRTAAAAATSVSKFTVSYQSAAIAGDETLSPAASIQRSQWRSPVPYLFGGLAAMLGLIALALLILACSYWKLSDEVTGGEERNERDLEGGAEAAKASPDFEERFLVIMAGEAKPTFLATRKAASFCEERISESKNKGNGNPRLDQDQIEVTTSHEFN